MPFEVGRRCYDRRPHIGADWTAHHILLGVLAEANARVSRNDFSKSIVMFSSTHRNTALGRMIASP